MQKIKNNQLNIFKNKDLLCGISAVNNKLCAGYKSSLVGSKEQNGIGNIVRLAEIAEGITLYVVVKIMGVVLNKRNFKLVVPMPRLDSVEEVVFIARNGKFPVTFGYKFHSAKIYCGAASG